jgi:hypothetical protein
MMSQDNQENQEIQADTMISVRDAYLALYYFVNAYWERGLRQDGKVVLLLHAIGPRERAGQIETNDPAFWDDWLEAVKAARSQGFPEGFE